MQIKRHIPNLITLLNLLSGCIALLFVSQHKYELVFFFVCLGIFFDFFDGFFARLYQVQSPLGLQLDSLADMVTSGVVPGYVMYQLINEYQNEGVSSLDPYFPLNAILPLIGFAITLGSCYRLAKFNIDTRQTDSFIGLPTPANALFILSLPLVIASSSSDFIVSSLINPYVLIGISFLSVYLLNAEIPLFSLKIKNFTVAKYKIQLLFLVLTLVLLWFFHVAGIPLVILTYVLLSVIHNKTNRITV